MTLGFKNFQGFTPICQGALLKSRLTSEAPAGLPLQYAYNELKSDKVKDVSLSGKLQWIFQNTPPEGKRYQHVCALRDFFRNNQVYWMTLEFNQSVEESQSHGPNGVKLSHHPY